MNGKENHLVRILDFNNIHQHSIYVKVLVYDDDTGKEYSDEIRFLNGMLYGDLVHTERSPLSLECRSYVQEVLLSKYEDGYFL